MAVPLTPDGTYYYVHEPEQGRHAPARALIRSADGRVLTRRRHGYGARVEVLDATPCALSVLALLRAAAAAGRSLERLGDGLARPFRVRLRGAGPARSSTEDDGVDCLSLDRNEVASAPIHHPVDASVHALIATTTAKPAVYSRASDALIAARRVLFFESLMNSDMPHNDGELSQGVLHMASTLRGSGTEVVMANVKMAITGAERPVVGLEQLADVLAGGSIDLVCITLLEGYFDGVVALIRELRRLGSRAHVAVGGVMPTLTPEHVAAHLPDVTFVCRGAGEYFVPRLAKVLGQSSIDQPFTEAQRATLLGMDGLLAIDRAGRSLLAANPAHTASVASLDGVQLDLSLLEARHIEQGLELSTSRGCVHKCAFCSIIGRQSYQARSAEGIFALLERYRERYRELFGDAVPNNAYRVHISDDDFACDRERARGFFIDLLSSPFRLASVQVSIADLCRRQGNVLLPEPDRELLDAIRPQCFADADARIPDGDFVADHKSRRWSSYLQIGVETFSDAELNRLGKGYDLAHVRAIVGELARRRIHMDAYLILANVDTTADDLVDSVEELCRLKLRHPLWFHVRFPVVPRLVSYFPSASHRRMVRNGLESALLLRAHAHGEGYPEFDYPFVDADQPRDAWVRAIDASVFTDTRLYTATLEALSHRFREAVAADPAERSATRERLLRRLDDRPRRLAFELLREAQAAARAHADAARDDLQARALASATAVLGPSEGWLPAYARYASHAAARLVVIPTWQCELRCTYCYIPKQDGRVMSRDTLERSVDLLMSTDRKEVVLQFFGGEALLEYELVQHGIDYALARAGALAKSIEFVLSSNGFSLDEAKLAWLATRPVKLELSLDGEPALQNLARPARNRGLDSYEQGIAPRAAAIVSSGLAHEVIMVVLPRHAHRVYESFFHVAGLGFTRIQINFALGVLWSDAQKRAFADGLFRIGGELRRRWARGERTTLVNLEAEPSSVRLNGEVTVDWDATVYAGNGFLHETEHKAKFKLGKLDDVRCFDRYWLDLPGNDFLLKWGYEPDVTRNNHAVGAIMASFVRWMRVDRQVAEVAVRQ